MQENEVDKFFDYTGYKNSFIKLFEEWVIFAQRILINSHPEIIVRDPIKSILISVIYKIRSRI